jgi:hypothetical protein
MPVIQNFSVPAGDSVDVNFDVDPDSGSLIGSTIYWRVYEQENGLPVPGSDPIIEKVLDDGLQITDPDLLQFVVELYRDDTIDRLRNYYHEATIKDADDNWVTVTLGIMTVTGTENRP